MSLFDTFLSILPGNDPRAAIYNSISPTQQGATATQQPTDPGRPDLVQQPTGGAGATGVAAQPGMPSVAPPASTGTPPDLSAMYMKLMSDADRRAQFDKGATLIAAGLSSDPVTRNNFQQMAMGMGPERRDPASVVSNLIALQEKINTQQKAAAMKARLPAIAKEYGLDLNTVNYLYEAGKLQETLNALAKPDKQIVSKNDGTQVIIDKNRPNSTPQVVDDTEKPKGYDIVDDGEGGKIAVNKQDPTDKVKVTDSKPNWVISDDPSNGSKIAVDLRNPNNKISVTDPNFTPTNDLRELWAINVERYSKGQPPLSTEAYLKERDKNRSKTIEKDPNNKLYEGFDKQLVDMSESAAASNKTINTIQEAHRALDKGVIGGNILSDKTKEGRKILASAFGLPRDAEDNTDVFQARMKEIVLPRVKALGAGTSISNSDRDYVDQAVGASGSMSPEVARRILLILEKGERNEIAKYNNSLKVRIGDDPELAKRVRYIDMPSVSSAMENAIPKEAVAKLQSDPTTINDFNARFGSGVGEHFLNKRAK